MTLEEIIAGCRRRDPAAMRELYDRYARTMFGVVCRYVRDRAMAEDLLHDGFVTLFTKVGDYRGEGAFEGWMRRIFVTTVLGWFRRRPPGWEALPVETLRRSDPAAEDAARRIETRDLLACMDELPDGYRTVLNLYAVEGYSHAEIGELLGISENTSRSQYSRARARLIELIRERERIYDGAVTERGWKA